VSERRKKRVVLDLARKGKGSSAAIF